MTMVQVLGAKMRQVACATVGVLFIGMTLFFSGCAGIANGTSPTHSLSTISITSPASGANVSGTITVNATATGSNTVTSVQLLVDGSNSGSPATTAPYSFSLNPSAPTNRD